MYLNCHSYYSLRYGTMAVETLVERPERPGPLLEAFVTGEIVKQIGWSRTRPDIHHFRTHTGREVDIVLEDRRGRCVAIEVKAAASIGPGDARNKGKTNCQVVADCIAVTSSPASFRISSGCGRF